MKNIYLPVMMVFLCCCASVNMDKEYFHKKTAQMTDSKRAKLILDKGIFILTIDDKIIDESKSILYLPPGKYELRVYFRKGRLYSKNNSSIKIELHEGETKEMKYSIRGSRRQQIIYYLR